MNSSCLKENNFMGDVVFCFFMAYNKQVYMKNKAGMVGGFVFGSLGFLLLFKFIFLDDIPPEDELAPGIVVFLSIIFGFVFAFIGSYIHKYFRKNRHTK